MKLDVISLDATPAGSIELDDAIFGLEPRADILHRMVRWQLAKRQAGTHSVLGKSDVSYSTKKIYRQKGTGGARHGSRKAPTFRHGGTYKGPTPRSHAHDLTKKFRALGLKHALSAKATAGELVVLDAATLAEGKTKLLAQAIKGLGWKRVAGHRRLGGERELRARCAQHRRFRRAAVGGRECLRHPAPRHAGPDQGRRRSAGGATEMSVKPELYDLIRRPIITEKATMASEHGGVVFEVSDGCDQARRSRKRSRPSSTSR